MPVSHPFVVAQIVDPVLELCKTLEPYSFEWWFQGCWFYAVPVAGLAAAGALVAALGLAWIVRLVLAARHEARVWA